MKFKDLTNMKFGRLLVLGQAERTNPKKIRWSCLCDCGNQLSVSAGNLSRSHTISCGCIQKENTSKANSKYVVRSRTPTYNSWASMITRTTSKSHKSYKIYKDLGVCTRWLNSFDDFVVDMGIRPDKTTLDRIDNKKGYFPENCRWATKKEQQNNLSSNVIIEWSGEKLNIQQWAEKLNISRDVLRGRIRLGWSIEKTLSTPKLG
jgi:predicted small secreted protein